MEKLTQARKNEILREKAFEMLIKEGLLGDTLLKVAGSKFMVNVDYEGEKIPVRIDFVVPKIDPEDTCQFAEDFAELYAKPLPEDKLPQVGTFTIYNSFGEAAKQSKFCKKILDGIVKQMKEDNKKQGRSENDPALKIAVSGITENPIESVILLTANKFSRNQADAIVNLANNKKFAAIISLLKK